MRPFGFGLATLILALASAAARAATPVYTVQSPEQAAGGTLLSATSVDDLDGDTVPDLLLLDSNGTETRVMVASGATGVIFHTLSAPHPSAVQPISDITGDGKPEILVGYPGDSSGASPARLDVHSGDLSTTAPLATIMPPSERGATSGIFAQTVGDITGDGKIDLAVRSFVAGQYPLEITDFFDGATLSVLEVPGRMEMILAGGNASEHFDVTGDGVVDFLMYRRDTVAGFLRAGRCFLVSGATGETVHAFESPAPSADGEFGIGALIVPDQTGDSIADIAIAALQQPDRWSTDTFPPAPVRLYDGATFALTRELSARGAMLGLLDDIDGDGRRDLAVGSESKIGIYNMASNRQLWIQDYYGANDSFYFAMGAPLPDIEKDGKVNFMVVDPRGVLGVYNGLRAVISVAPQLWAGRRDPNDGPRTTAVYIYSWGDLPLVVGNDGIGIVGPNASEFTLLRNGAGDVLYPGSPGTSYAIRFDPAGEGTRTATIRIPSNDPDEPVVEVALSGLGDPNPPPCSQPIYLSINNTLYFVDSVSGNRHYLAGSDRGSGSSNYWLAQDEAGNLFSSSPTRAGGALARIQANGDSSLLPYQSPSSSGPIIGSGNVLYGTGRSDLNSLEMTTGTSRIVSGTIPDDTYLTLLALGPANTATVQDTSKRLWAIDTETGACTLIAEAPGMTFSAMAASSQFGWLYGVTGGEEIWRIDPADGSMNVVASNLIGDGPGFESLKCIVMADEEDHVLVFDASQGAIIKVNVYTGDRLIVSSEAAGIGRGPSLATASQYATISMVFSRVAVPLAAGDHWAQME